MAKFKYFLAIGLAKFISFFLKLKGSGATAAPGFFASKIDKQLLSKLSKQLKFSIVISGTNGKTTTSRMLAAIFKYSKIKYFHNRAGSNLQRGIVSELIKHWTIKGLPKERIGLWEIDEAVLPIIIKKIKPKIVVITNLFRDQLDRYGEIDTLAKKWQKALKLLPHNSTAILNADDPKVASLGKNLSCKVLYFGLRDKKLGTNSLSHASDATLCPKCLLPLKYQACFISHLGIYQCPKCANIQPQPQIMGLKIIKKNQQINMLIKHFCQTTGVLFSLPGTYNLYNLLAAFAVASSLKIKTEKIVQGISLFKPAFGRFETIKLKNKTLKILLVKNPAGFNEVIKLICKDSSYQSFACLIAINDNIADGRDVSWIWDVDFKNLKNIKSLKKIIVSGTRAYDMALRLKHAGLTINNKQLTINNNLKHAISTLINQSNKNLFILPTYTAMLETRKILNKMKLVHSTWKD